MNWRQRKVPWDYFCYYTSVFIPNPPLSLKKCKVLHWGPSQPGYLFTKLGNFPQNFALEAFVQYTASTTNIQPILYKQKHFHLYTQNDVLYFSLYIDSTNSLNTMYFNYGLSSSYSFIGKWTHVAAVRDNCDVKLYINGGLVKTG